MSRYRAPPAATTSQVRRFKLPAFIEGSNVSDTMIPGLKVRFTKDGAGLSGVVLHTESERILLEAPAGRIRLKIGKREFVKRVNESRLNEIDWSAIDERTLKLGEHVELARTARHQIWGQES